MKTAIVDYGLVSAYGFSADACWNGLMDKRSAIKTINRFAVNNFFSSKAAFLEDLDVKSKESLVIQMLKKVFLGKQKEFGKKTKVILASTLGEIDFLERNDFKKSSLNVLAEKVKKICAVEKVPIVISSACISSSVALAYAHFLISSAKEDSVLVVACDSVSEFIYSGFSSLMALDKIGARPFDKNRMGLTIGEAAGFMLLTTQKNAKKDKRNILGFLNSTGLTADANHMTGPSRDGSGLAQAINIALRSAKIQTQDIGSICAHGTGTVYNDSMEMKAFKTVFGKKCIPTYSVKGGTGHTMGAAGLLEAIISLKSLKEKIIPPTVNLYEIDEEANGWVSKDAVKMDNCKFVLSTNAGVGGVNSALVLSGS